MPNPNVRRRIRGTDIPPFNFEAQYATFTPSMAKRTTTVFNASPIVQGAKDGTGLDVLSISRGAQIASYWYANFDPYQGSYSQRWNPEFSSSGIATGLHYFFYASSTYYFAYDYSNARYEFKIGDQTLTVASAVTAGTPINLVVSWDVKNTIDGTNYVRVSINDAHTFGVTVAPTIAAPSATLYIGSNGTAGALSAIQEGQTIWRRVLYDGTYGINAGNGDEINLIYAAGAGIDPTMITGSWDVCFCLPTNSTAGAMVTGAGEAWSHPHSSNAITPADGFMTNATAWTNWTAVGAPTAADVLATAEKIYQWGYKFTATGAGDGYKIAVAVTAGADYRLRVLAHSDGTGQPQVVVYDETNVATIVTVTGTTAATRTAPDVLETCFEIPAGCTSISVRLLNAIATNIVYFHQAVLLTNLWDDGGFETGTAVTNIGSPTVSAQSNEQAHSGTYSWKITTAANNEGFSRVRTVVSGKYYIVSAWIFPVNGSAFLSLDGGVFQRGVGVDQLVTSIAGVWQKISVVIRTTATSLTVKFRAYSNPRTFYTDDVCVRLLDDVSITCAPASAANSLEGTGYRVDGYDTLTQPIPAGKLKANRGRVRFSVTPRDSAANFVKFGTAPRYWFKMYASASNYLYLTESAANTLTLSINSNGAGLQTANYDCTSAIVAGTKYQTELAYMSGKIQLKINGVVKATITTPINFTAFPATAEFGCATSSQADAVFG